MFPAPFGGEVGGVDLLFEKLRLETAENFLSPLSCQHLEEQRGGLEMGVVEGQCLLISAVSYMPFFELTVLCWALVLLYV